MTNVVVGIKGFVARPISDRFYEKVVIRENGCWEWPTHKGYPSIFIDGKPKKSSKVSWELFHKEPFPENMDACHTCDNPNCVNPIHIFPGTAKDNAQDALRKGRLKITPKKDFCINGHAYEGYNIYITKIGTRACRTCHVEATKRFRERARAALSDKEVTNG